MSIKLCQRLGRAEGSATAIEKYKFFKAQTEQCVFLLGNIFFPCFSCQSLAPVLLQVSQPEDKRSRQQVQQQLQLQLQPVQIQQVQQQSRPATRSKPLPQAHAAGVNRGPKDRPKSQVAGFF